MENETKQTTVAFSHDFVAASDCALYLRDNFHHLSHSRFTVEPMKCYKGPGKSGEYSMWRLVILDDLDRIKNELDVGYTNEVVSVAEAFIAGRGGMPIAAKGAVF